MRKELLFMLVSASLFTEASTLSIYQDKSLYRYHPQHVFIGLTRDIGAKCEGESIPLAVMTACPESARLCSTLFLKAEALQTKLRENSLNSKVLDTLVSLPKPNAIDAKTTITAARAIAKEQARLLEQKRTFTRESKRLKTRFAKETRAAIPLGFAKPCKGSVELTIPYGYITFQTAYEATLLPERQIEVTQKLSIVNRSGIDIEADRAHFHYRSATQYVRPVHFQPWVVRERPELRRKSISKRMLTETMAANDKMNGDIAPAPMQAQYDESREYTIKALKLPSTGEPVDVPVMSWKVPVTCQTELYAYRNTNAYEVCSFTPKFQIERNSWKVKNAKGIINDRASGEYEKSLYKLYIKNDEDIAVIRKPVVDKEKESGIFGGTIRKKDGFTLEIANKSDKPKTIRVIERIPVPNTDKITVKLLTVSGNTYKQLKDGKLEMYVTLAPHAHKEIEVLFEISYDKDLKIVY
jgi:hypothetical protein